MAPVPIMLEMQNLRVLFVGGGTSARQKLITFLDNGAALKVVSPTLTADIQPLARAARFKWIARPYQQDDVRDVQLVMACTSDPQVNDQVVQDARDYGVLAGNVSHQGPRDMAMMASVHRDPLVLAVSTSGQAPLLAPILAQELATSLDPRWIHLLVALNEFRQGVVAQYSMEKKRELWRNLKTFPFKAWLEHTQDTWTPNEWIERVKQALQDWQRQ